jgi:uncharacterized membrane-anchored protein YhcB (DUF1043 family)
MTVLIFLLGSLLGLLVGALTCIRFVRQQVTGDLGPRLQRIQSQLDSVQAELTLAVGARYAELTAHLATDPRRQLR